MTCIYTVIEYIPDAAFQGLSTQVAQACLEGDTDKQKALIAEMNKADWKLIIWSYNHKEKGLTELPDEYYEVEQTKSKIVLDLLIHIGVFIPKLCQTVHVRILL